MVGSNLGIGSGIDFGLDFGLECGFDKKTERFVDTLAGRTDHIVVVVVAVADRC